MSKYSNLSTADQTDLCLFFLWVLIVPDNDWLVGRFVRWFICWSSSKLKSFNKADAQTWFLVGPLRSGMCGMASINVDEIASSGKLCQSKNLELILITFQRC